MANIRLFVDQPLIDGAADIAVSGAQAHYLLDVMRLPLGGEVSLFNGCDGEWCARLTERGKKSCRLQLEARRRLPVAEPGPWLLFALLKRNGTDLVVEKATELGVERLLPVITRQTVVGPPNNDRLHAISIEAAEQCGRLTVPALQLAAPLATTLAGWPSDRPLLVMTPHGPAIPFRELHPTSLGESCQSPVMPPGILIGPEGGFAASELDELLALPFATAVSLGPLVLRAETAAIAALVCWQALAGAWVSVPAEGAD